LKNHGPDATFSRTDSFFLIRSDGLARFKDQHGLVYKKLVGESAAVDSESTEAWLERLPSLLKGYERDIYNAD
jgi:hypothetical protein